MAPSRRKAKPKHWSYSAGSRGKNRIRVFERPGRGFWVDYYEESGRRHREPLEALGITTRDQAREYADGKAVEFRRAAERKPRAREELTLAALIEIYDREVTRRK